MESVTQKIGLKPDEKLLLMVARMDRIKSHNVAYQGALIRKGHGKIPFSALIGNGSFSSSKKGGLGHGKGGRWRAQLEALVKELHLEGSVSFLGYVSFDELKAAYSLASVVLLTSGSKGSVLACWKDGQTRSRWVVSKGAGTQELVVDGFEWFHLPAGRCSESRGLYTKVGWTWCRKVSAKMDLKPLNSATLTLLSKGKEILERSDFDL